jgi:hypothetical protein
VQVPIIAATTAGRTLPALAFSRYAAGYGITELCDYVRATGQAIPH